MERERRSREYWEKELSEYWDSGLTVQEYSELKELPYESVRRWIRRLKQERPGVAKVDFVEVKAPSVPISTGTKPGGKMNDLPKLYFTMETYLFPLLEEELCELTAKMKEFLRIVEMIKPSRFITSTLRWSGLGRPMKDREKMLRAFFLKAVYDFPTTKGLIENLKTNPSLRRLCGWEYRGEVPSEATFSRAFGIFSREKVCNAIHAAVVRENYTDKLVGHASLDSTAIIGREKACRKNKPKLKLKKKRGRKSIAEKAALSKQEIAEIKTRRLELQVLQTLPENLADLPQGCDWGGKRDSKGKTSYWYHFRDVQTLF